MNRSVKIGLVVLGLLLVGVPAASAQDVDQRAEVGSRTTQDVNLDEGTVLAALALGGRGGIDFFPGDVAFSRTRTFDLDRDVDFDEDDVLSLIVLDRALDGFGFGFGDLRFRTFGDRLLFDDDDFLVDRLVFGDRFDRLAFDDDDFFEDRLFFDDDDFFVDRLLFDDDDFFFGDRRFARDVSFTRDVDLDEDDVLLFLALGDDFDDIFPGRISTERRLLSDFERDFDIDRSDALLLSVLS